jgi:hypothetical protein
MTRERRNFVLASVVSVSVVVVYARATFVRIR